MKADERESNLLLSNIRLTPHPSNDEFAVFYFKIDLKAASWVMTIKHISNYINYSSPIVLAVLLSLKLSSNGSESSLQIRDLKSEISNAFFMNK
jgi:hypothetical protein